MFGAQRFFEVPFSRDGRASPQVPVATEVAPTGEGFRLSECLVRRGFSRFPSVATVVPHRKSLSRLKSLPQVKASAYLNVRCAEVFRGSLQSRRSCLTASPCRD